ncbi:MAG: hypothetical protein OXC92_08590 [Flavobacteriaceae bacterium]|nr:hypothetical protein [Flavobacteriaceae bacterium]MCY4217023.1 hypothetical protein [Flavobacteriaceae bacterium]MCY4253678.1 hypothetical protein [Flavobacteriaceae bacterium]
MLTKEEEEIVLDELKIFQPVRLAWTTDSAYQIDSNIIEILYDFKDTSLGYFELIGAMQKIEKRIPKKFDFTGFEDIPKNVEEDVLKASKTFFNDREKEREHSVSL